METFATIEDYDARFPGRTAPDGVLQECLMSATVAMASALDGRVDYSDPDERLSFALMDVCRSVANRILPDTMELPVGVTEATVTAGGFSQSLKLGAAYGVPKLLPGEKAMLGIGGGRVGWAPLGRRGCCHAAVPR